MLTKTAGPGQRGREGRARARPELDGRGQEVLDRPDDQGQGRHADRRRPRASRRRRSTRPRSRRQENKLDRARSRPSSATTSSRSRRSRRPRSRRWRRPRRRSSRSCQPAADQRPRTRSSRLVQEALAAQDRVPQGYAMADCKGYKAPKTGDDDGAAARPTRSRARPRTRRDAPSGTAGRRTSLRARSRALDELTRRLRKECPWDREQDERSIVPHTVEEAYELADAANRGDDAKLLDELGDVLFQVHFLSLLLEERGAGDLAQVAEHVHRQADPPPPARVRRGRGRDRRRGAAQLGPIKQRRARPRAGHLRRGAREPARPAVRAQGAAPGGVAAASTSRSRGPLRRGRATSSSELEAGRRRASERFHEVGDVLFAAVNVARKLQVDPELALRAAAERFRGRVEAAEELAASDGPKLERSRRRRAAHLLRAERG